MNLPSSTSLWLETTPLTNYPALSPNLEVDVAIIGGGIAGLMTAYFLKQQGKNVVVIEAKKIVTGTTGHTTAHISIAHDIVYSHLMQSFSKDIAKLYASANQTAIHTIRDISLKEKIECDFNIVDEYIFTADHQSAEAVEKEFQATESLGLETSLLDQAPLPFPTGKTIRYPHQARFHPRRFLLGLAERIIGNNSYIFENTRALDVAEGQPMVVETDKGPLKAHDVVVSTLYPFLDRGFYFARLEAHSSYVLAVQLKTEFPDALFDSSETNSHYIRRQPVEGRDVVIIGGEGHKTGEVNDTAAQYEKLAEYAHKNLPVEVMLYKWSTHDTYSYDGLPYIGKFLPMSDHLWVAAGFQGWGMTNGVVAGLLLTDLISGHDNPWLPAFDPGRFKPTSDLLKQNLNVGKMFVKSKLFQKPRAETVKISSNEWKIVEHEGKKIAAYRDNEGKLHAVHAVCQHMGCNVGFNNAEKTWDCPCHGSRYSLDGEVLYGPTVKPLEKIELEA